MKTATKLLFSIEISCSRGFSRHLLIRPRCSGRNPTPSPPTTTTRFTSTSYATPPFLHYIFVTFGQVREHGSTKVKIQIIDPKRAAIYTLTVRSNPDKSSSASFLSSKDNPGTALTVAGSEAFADFDLTSVLIPGSIVSLKVVVELAGHKGANVLLTHRRGDVFCDDRFVVVVCYTVVLGGVSCHAMFLALSVT